MKKYIIITLLLLSCCFFVGAQQLKVDSLFKELAKAKEDTGKVNLYRLLSVNLKFTDPAQAIEHGNKGVLLSKKLGFDNGTAGCYLSISTGYIYSDKLDSAMLFLDTALQYAHKGGDLNRLGLAYLNKADIYRQLQNYEQSLKNCETAFEYASKANNDDIKARVNQTFGSVYSQQDMYPESIPFYEKAIDLYRKTGNSRMSAAVLSNLGIAYKMLKDYPKAVASTLSAIRIIDSLKDITNQSIFNGNLSDIYSLMGNYTEAAAYADKAMDYAIAQHNDNLIAVACVMKGSNYKNQEKYAEAITALDKAMPYFISIDDKDRIDKTAEMLAEAYAKAGNYTKAYEYMVMSRSASDSVVKWEYEDAVAAMQTKFEVKEKDDKILLLNKDKELQQQRLQKQRLLMTGTVVLALLVSGGLWLLLNRNKLKQRMKELELRNQIAADLHDEVGSSLSSIHMLSQMATQQGNEATHKDILTRMSGNAKETMDKMGDIVWMIKPGESEGTSLKQRMERFAYEICSSKNIGTSIELDELEKVRLTMEQRKNVYLIFKEALNNAVKYSETEKVDIKATVQNKELTLMIKDYGKGFDAETTGRGNGLDNMKHRAAEMNGTLQVNSSAGEGTEIILKVPV